MWPVVLGSLVRPSGHQVYRDGSVYGKVDLMGERVYGAIANLPHWRGRMSFRVLLVHRAVDTGQPVGAGVVPIQAVS